MRATSMRSSSAMAPTASPAATSVSPASWGKVGGLYRSDIAGHAARAGKDRLRCRQRRRPAGLQDAPLDRRLAGEERPRADLLPQHENCRGPPLAAGEANDRTARSGCARTSIDRSRHPNGRRVFPAARCCRMTLPKCIDCCRLPMCKDVGFLTSRIGGRNSPAIPNSTRRFVFWSSARAGSPARRFAGRAPS